MFQFMEIFGDMMRVVTFQRQSENPSRLHEDSPVPHRWVPRPGRRTVPSRR